MYKMSDVMAESERQDALVIDYKHIDTMAAGRYGRVAYELLRVHQPSVFCEFYYNDRFEEWIIEQDNKWCTREVELFSQLKEDYEQIPAIDPMQRVRQATTAQEQAREIVLSEIAGELPELMDVLRPEDLFSSF